jgi:hypothetical protein
MKQSQRTRRDRKASEPIFVILERPVEDTNREPITKLSPRCSHGPRGSWVVASDGTFLPLIRIDGVIDKPKSDPGLVRWYCTECSTVQDR